MGYTYRTTKVEAGADGKYIATPLETAYDFKTERKVPKTGMMLVGWGGNNGTTVKAGTDANTHKDVNIPFSQVLPMVHPNDLVIGGWDISKMNMAEAMDRAKVLEPTLKAQVKKEMSAMVPLPSVYYPDFIAANQEDRADNVLEGSKACNAHVEKLRQDIRDFKAANKLDKVILLWTANTERFSELKEGVHDTAEGILAALARNEAELAPSACYCIAAIQEGCAYVNGAPQNTLVPGLVELAKKAGVYVAGDDFKSGQTKMKSALVEFFVGAGIKPECIASYNHLGNNDGRNLASPKQFRSKEITKSNVVDDMVASNKILYPDGKGPDHCIVIKYLPYVGDSKRAMDEYTFQIFMGGEQVVVMHNTCEDSLLAAPLILDLVILTELMQRVEIAEEGQDKYHQMNTVLSVLSYLLKAPFVPEKTPVVNALNRQRSCIENILRALVGLPPEHSMLLEAKTPIQF